MLDKLPTELVLLIISFAGDDTSLPWTTTWIRRLWKLHHTPLAALKIATFSAAVADEYHSVAVAAMIASHTRQILRSSVVAAVLYPRLPSVVYITNRKCGATSLVIKYCKALLLHTTATIAIASIVIERARHVIFNISTTHRLVAIEIGECRHAFELYKHSPADITILHDIGYTLHTTWPHCTRIESYVPGTFFHGEYIYNNNDPPWKTPE
jgi:hypothetical protein